MTKISEPMTLSRRRGGRPARADAETLSRAILAAAETAFLAEGFGGARMEAIAAAAGTTKQTVYARFGGKEALFVAVSNGLLKDRFTTSEPTSGPLREALVKVADEMLAAMLDPKLVRMYGIITAEAVRFPELARMTDEDDTFPGRVIIQGLLSEAARRDEIDCDDPHRSMIMLQTMILAEPLKSAALGLGRLKKPDDLRAWSRFAVDLFLDGARRR
jgi:AcrR family transcriptional regulator